MLHDFYGPERNAAGAFRWSQPRAALTLPVAGPATYRLLLTMQDSPTVAPPRQVAVAVNGAAVSAVTLDHTPREYTFAHRLDAAAWTADPQHALQVELRTAPFEPPGDPRALGVILSRVRVEFAERPRPWSPALLLPNACLLAVAYGALRLLGVGVLGAAAALGAPLAIGGLLSTGGYVDALALAAEACAQPLAFLGFLLCLAATPWLARLPPGLAGALGLFVALRLLFSLAGLALAAALPLPAPCSGGEAAPALDATGAAFRLLGVWQRRDACWYERIAAVGYRPGERSAAFFPLYPALLRAVGALTAGDLTLGGLVVCGAAYVAAMAGLYRLVRRDFAAPVARRARLYLSVFPAAFFLFAPFSEALFLALAVWALDAARRGRWGWAGLAALLAGFTRAQGALLAVPLAWEAWRHWRQGGRQAPGGRGASGLLLGLAPLAALCDLPLFALYGARATGSTPVQAEGLWRSSLRAPWTVVALAWHDLRARGASAEAAIEALYLALLLLFGLLLVLGLRRLPLAYSLYTAPQLLLLGVRTNYIPLTST